MDDRDVDQHLEDRHEAKLVRDHERAEHEEEEDLPSRKTQAGERIAPERGKERLDGVISDARKVLLRMYSRTCSRERVGYALESSGCRAGARNRTLSGSVFNEVETLQRNGMKKSSATTESTT